MTKILKLLKEALLRVYYNTYFRKIDKLTNRGFWMSKDGVLFLVRIVFLICLFLPRMIQLTQLNSLFFLNFNHCGSVELEH